MVIVALVLVCGVMDFRPSSKPQRPMNYRLIPAIISVIGIFTLSSLAQEAEPSPPTEPSPTPPVASVSPSPTTSGTQTEVEVHEFKRAQIHDVQFDASNGRIFFKVGDVEYDWRPAIEEKAPASVADEISASAAVLGEFRRAPRIIVRVAAKPDKPKQYLVRRMVFVFDSLK